MKKIGKIKKIIGFVMLGLIIVICVYALLIVLPNRKNKGVEEVNKIKFGYVLYDRDNSVYKDVFESLKDTLESDEIDYEKYAEYISKLFVIDLYTLNNKVSKDDIGGTQYVEESIKENFELNASRTMYKYISNENKKNLPEVTNIELIEIKSSKYKISDKEYDSYEVSLKWEYKEDLGYDKEGTIYVVNKEDKLFVVEKK